MEIITIRFPEHLIKAIDDLVEEGLFVSRSEFIRFAVREVLKDVYAYKKILPRSDRPLIEKISEEKERR